MCMGRDSMNQIFARFVLHVGVLGVTVQAVASIARVLPARLC